MVPCLQVGITLGLLLPPKPSHPSMQMEVDFTDFLIAADVGYAVVLYLWLMVRAGTCCVALLCTHLPLASALAFAPTKLESRLPLASSRVGLCSGSCWAGK